MATGECGRFVMAQDVQRGEVIVLLKKAFDMSLLTESLISERVREGNRRGSNSGQELEYHEAWILRVYCRGISSSCAN